MPTPVNFATFMTDAFASTPERIAAHLAEAAVTELRTLTPPDWQAWLDWIANCREKHLALEMARALSWIPAAADDARTYQFLIAQGDADVVLALCVVVRDERRPALFSCLKEMSPSHASLLLSQAPHLHARLSPGGTSVD
jgi:hypothetical protein